MLKQGFEEVYSQRFKEGNIVRLKISGLRLHRLRLYRLHRLDWVKVWTLGYGGRGVDEIINSSLSRKNENPLSFVVRWGGGVQ